MVSAMHNIVIKRHRYPNDTVNNTSIKNVFLDIL